MDRKNVKNHKILYILNVANKVNNFSFASMAAAQNLGFEFHIAGNWGYPSVDERKLDEEKHGIRIHQIDFIRAPYHPGNLSAYRQLKALVERECFDIIHCNTPIGGVLGRLVGCRCRVPRVIYQAHGFHFYKGAPVLNWLLYYPVEKWLARYTDVLITINREDYEFAKTKLKLRGNGKVYYVPGVGLQTTQFNTAGTFCSTKRGELGLNNDDIAVIAMGDLIKRKNYDVAIRAIAETGNSTLHYFICGQGPETDKLKTLAQRLGISKQIHFLGFRSDVKELLAVADIFLFTTKQEGLPRSLMEAMASGLPCIVSNIRGNVDLIEDGKGGFLCDPLDVSAFKEKINVLTYDLRLRKRMGEWNVCAVDKFSTEIVIEEICGIYAELAERL